jgi:hypothetical protein
MTRLEAQELKERPHHGTFQHSNLLDARLINAKGTLCLCAVVVLMEGVGRPPSAIKKRREPIGGEQNLLRTR